jgi:DNA-binding transcriptional ArsR family regulator
MAPKKSKLISRTSVNSRRPRKKIPSRVSENSEEVACEVIPESFQMTRIDQLKSMSVPIRLRILEAMAVRPMTTKQAALQLGKPVTGLYRHVDALAEAGLLVLVAEVPKRGTVQKYYRAAAHRFVADDSCMPRGENADPRIDAVLQLVSDVRNGVTQCTTGLDTETTAFISAAVAMITIDRDSVAQLMEAITTTIQNFKAPKPRKTVPRNSVRIAVFIYPAGASED